jgi:nitroreductase
MRGAFRWPLRAAPRNMPSDGPETSGEVPELTTILPADEALRTRRSVRGFKPDPVPRERVEEILALAARAPSGSNIQPWHVYVTAGAAKEALSRALVEDYLERGGTSQAQEYHYYPREWREPYIGRRRKLGWGLYGLLGIGRDNKDRMRRQHARNYEFFGAPVGLVFTLERDMEIGSWLDLGIFLGGIMAAARGFGLDTCPQAAFAPYHPILRKHLPIPDDQIVVCGMSLGTADPDEPANALDTERLPVAEFARFVGMD